ncbi:MAG: molybdopterin-dependent oxidoreductase, partial [Phycisphaerales bacterium]|nr:molybdopterin-dependent oxidoreductase [Phycisphaerales bacterium]
AAGVSVPQYCYHDGLSIVASCRICLCEVWAPNPKSGQLEPFMGGKLVPSCQQTASDGMVVYTDSPKAVANQKAVMEYLLINHPLDCPVCDQSGECFLQDYSYQYGRGVSRFQEQKVKQPKKDLGDHVLLYSDRCIMCTRCVRFTREVTATGELMVMGRGNKEEIDIFPGVPINNELSANVIDLCPVGALLDKDFLFQQRVWFLKETASIDPLTASGDNIWIHHNEGKIYRVKPRHNPQVNKWWITDEVRYGWKFVHSSSRLRTPLRRQYGVLAQTDFPRAYELALEGLSKAVAAGKHVALLISPMLSCEDAYLLGRAALAIDPGAIFGLGPVPFKGSDKVFPIGSDEGSPRAFKVYAEKAPNARGVRRVLSALSPTGGVLEFDKFLAAMGKGTGSSSAGGVILTGNYPTDWVTDDLLASLGGKFVVVIDTLGGALAERADVVIPGATFAEKSGTFENARNMLQSFDAAFPPIEGSRPEAQIGLDLLHLISIGGQYERAGGTRPSTFDAAAARREMGAAYPALQQVATTAAAPARARPVDADMQLVEL